jgi:acetyltransferase-like isoleucine patch superfamily enzyme
MLGKFFVAITRSLRHRYRMLRYNEFNIAEYFRAQGARVGSDCRIYIRELSAEPWLVRIGNHVTITAGVALVTHDGSTWIFTGRYPSLQRFDAIDIRDNCFIGLGAMIMGGVTVGPNAIVAARSVVTRDVPPNTIVGGSPARVLGTTEQYLEKLLGLWEKQRPPGYLSEFIDGVHYPAELVHRAKIRDFPLLRRHLGRLYRGE